MGRRDGTAAKTWGQEGKKDTTITSAPQRRGHHPAESSKLNNRIGVVRQRGVGNATDMEMEERNEKVEDQRYEDTSHPVYYREEIRGKRG